MGSFRMFVHPVVVGQGERLFEDVQLKISLELISQENYQNRVVGLYYQNTNESIDGQSWRFIIQTRKRSWQ